MAFGIEKTFVLNDSVRKKCHLELGRHMWGKCAGKSHQMHTLGCLTGISGPGVGHSYFWILKVIHLRNVVYQMYIPRKTMQLATCMRREKHSIYICIKATQMLPGDICLQLWS